MTNFANLFQNKFVKKIGSAFSHVSDNFKAAREKSFRLLLPVTRVLFCVLLGSVMFKLPGVEQQLFLRENFTHFNKDVQTRR